MIKNHIKQFIVLYIIIFLASILLLFNLGNMYLWKDEASTAQIGYNTMTYGYPRVWDNKNLMTGADGNEFNDDFAITNHGWLQYYIAGISIKALGKTTIAARLPFALISIGTIIISWFLARLVFKRIRNANLTAFTFAIYVPFILYSRQARYYSLVFFFCILTLLLLFQLFGYLKGERKYKISRRIYVQILFCLSIFLLFCSNHLSGIILISSIVLYLFLFETSLILKVGFNIGIGVLLWLPWYIYTNILSDISSYTLTGLESNFIIKILIILWKIQTYFIPFQLLFLLVLAIRLYCFIAKKRNIQVLGKRCIIFVIIAINTIVIISVPKWGIVNHYLLCIVVIVPFLLTAFINYIFKYNKYLSVILYIIIMSCNVFNIFPYLLVDKDFKNTNNKVNNFLSQNYKETTNRFLVASPVTLSDFTIEPLNDYLKTLTIQSYMFSYLKEIASDYDCPTEEIVKTLNQYGLPNETVIFIGGEYEFDPIVYYTNLRVVKNLDEKLRPWGEYLSYYPNQKKYSHLTYVPDESIDWIIFRQGYDTFLFDDPQYLEKAKSEFDIFESKNIDIPLSNSPDLDYHKFTTVLSGPKFIIMHRNTKN